MDVNMDNQEADKSERKDVVTIRIYTIIGHTVYYFIFLNGIYQI